MPPSIKSVTLSITRPILSLRITRILLILLITSSFLTICTLPSPFTWTSRINRTRFNLSNPTIFSSSPSQNKKQKNAFAILLSPNYLPDVSQNDTVSDEYFLATRVLTYQLLHSSSTCSPDIPLLILAPPTVSPLKLSILEKEGAIIVPVPFVRADWIVPPIPQWDAMMSKLFLWTLTEYDRILYLDADILLFSSLTDIFNDPGSFSYPTNFNRSLPDSPRELLLPDTYTLGGVLDGGSGSRANPFWDDYLNGGFFMMKPDLGLFNYYISFVEEENSFSTTMMEQNLINYVHRQDGPMPWKKLDEKWDTSCPEETDIEKGWKSVHGKFWRLEGDNCGLDPVASRHWWRVLGRMESGMGGGPLDF